jgi:hypothetical protein
VPLHDSYAHLVRILWGHWRGLVYSPVNDIGTGNDVIIHIIAWWWRQRGPLKRWAVVSYWSGWLPARILLHLVTAKARNSSPIHCELLLHYTQRPRHLEHVRQSVIRPVQTCDIFITSCKCIRELLHEKEASPDPFSLWASCILCCVELIPKVCTVQTFQIHPEWYSWATSYLTSQNILWAPWTSNSLKTTDDISSMKNEKCKEK